MLFVQLHLLDGGAMQLTFGMGGFGLALAFPFALFALFPNWLQSLPKSGGWFNTVKVVLGFLEVALAFKFLSRQIW
jgi:thiol:disulfide interchange protein DsbD